MADGYFTIDGKQYKEEFVTAAGLELYKKLQSVTVKIQELTNLKVVLTKAKNCYINDLKAEIVSGKTGLELSQLFVTD
jgi:hypothetical protein